MSDATTPLNVLLIEDDDIDVENVRRAFKKGNVNCPLWVARDGVEGLQMLGGNEYPKSRRLVIMDVNLPRKSGIEVLREMRADPNLRDTKVLILTSSDERVDKDNAQALGVSGYMIKPLDFTIFVEMLVSRLAYWAEFATAIDEAFSTRD